MAAASCPTWKHFNDEALVELTQTIWGDNVAEDVFLRWSEGLNFGDTEPTALLQRSGGPCAIIAPLQAYVLKNLLFKQSKDNSAVDLKSIPESEVKRSLKASICDILSHISINSQYTLVSYSNQHDQEPSTSADSDGESSNKRPKLFSVDNFHKQLKYLICQKDDLVSVVEEYASQLIGDFGVLCFLYSVVSTAGVEVLRAVVSESGEPLIDPTFGHGGQCLVNLLLTGESTPHVFDGEKDLGGMRLKGISTQSQVGFLSVLESHRYLEVGWNYKSPVYPIWVLASETHLTVIFSKSMDVVQPDKQSEVLKVVNSYDKEGNGFISTDCLTELMSSLDLISEPDEYVQLMKDKLDSENWGVFLITNFMEQFFPKDENSSKSSDYFEIYHYNGIKGSNNSNKITYHRAKARLLDFLEPTVTPDTSHIFNCLQTKWPTIELLWDEGVVPSLN